MSAKLSEIRHLSLVEQIVEALEKQILSGGFKPGERLIEMTLAEQFNVSRASVREALRLLESQGFVVSVPRKGVSVACLSAKEAHDIFVIRAQLESLALSLAIRQQDTKVLEELKRIFQGMEKAAFENDAETYRELDISFHQVTYRGCNNAQLIRLLESFNKQTMRYREEYLNTPQRLARSLAIHREILELFISNEPEKAEEFRKKSMLENAKLLVQRITDDDLSCDMLEASQ